MSENMADPQAGRARILVGVDGSKDGLRAVGYAMHEALAKEADLWVVTVVDYAAPIGGLWELVSSQEMLNSLGESAIAQALAFLGDEGFPAGRVTSEVRLGPPGETLAELSGSAELLVVGRRAVGGLERLFVGSTSVWVAVHAKCPVIVISAASTPQVTGGLGVVAVGINTWPVHSSALEWGFTEAKLRGARLRVVHVVPETLGIEGQAFVESANAGLEHQLEGVRSEHPGVQVDVDVQLGDPVAALVATSAAVDLLIIGTHHERAMLGGPTRGVIAHAHCPVGLIRSHEPA